MRYYIALSAEDTALPCCLIRSQYEELCSFVRAVLKGICRFDSDGIPSLVIEDSHNGIRISSTSADEIIMLERPFAAAALVNAISSLLSRKSPVNFFADEDTCSAVLGDASVKLTPTEFRLFSAILKNGGGFVSASDLSLSVWGKYDRNLCTVYLSYLRRKLDGTFGDGTLISVRGKGYRLRISGHLL